MKNKIAMAVLGAALILPAVSFAADVDNGTTVVQHHRQSTKTFIRSDDGQSRLRQESNLPGGVGG